MSSLRILFTHREMDLIVLTLAQRLAEEELFEVYVTYPESTEPDTATAPSVHYLPLAPLSGKISWSAIKQLRAYNREYRFDAIYSVSSSGLSNALWATLGSKAKNVGYRGTGAKVRRLDLSYYMAVLNPRLEHLVCENIHIEKYLGQFIKPEKLSTAEKPFDLAWVEEASRSPIRLALADGGVPSLSIVSVGNTKGRPHKGLRTLLEAIDLLPELDLSVVIVGDYEPSDYDYAMSQEGKPTYHFVGTSNQALRYIAGADVYVLPSYRDASPRVLREAMALGLPTIVSDIEGSRDLIIPDETGLLFEAGNAWQLAKQIQHLLHQPELRRQMGKRGVERIRTHFAFERYVNYFRELFIRLSR